jgi:mannose-1-phosphate guanylyltransferase
MGAILGEPCRRDTAPCIGLAALHVRRRDPAAVMAVMPADHVIESPAAFQQALRQAEQWVAADPQRLVTFGIRPTYPSPSFGYIERGEALDADQGVYQVARFREKPNPEVAQAFLDAGSFFWNSGIFVWRAERILELLGRFQPELMARLEAIDRAHGTAAEAAVLAEEFAAIRGVSIDYAVLERAADIAVIAAPFAWDDVGSWQAMARLLGSDAQGNTIVGRHLGVDTKDCIVRTTAGHLVATLGLADCIVVHTPDATLVANKHDEEAIRRLVQLLEERGWTEYLE